MSPYLMFAAGGVFGIMLHKIVADTIAKKRRNEIIKAMVESAGKVVDFLADNGEKDDPEDEAAVNGVINMKETIEKNGEVIDDFLK